MALLELLGLFVLSLIVLIKASGVFTGAAEKIGISFGIPSFIIGVTIVSIGTSLPELISSVLAVLNGSSEIVIGNVAGSNVTNIFFVLGVVAIAGKKLEIDYELLQVDLPLLVGSAMLLYATVADGVFTSGEAVVCLVGFIVYFLYALGVEKRLEGDGDVNRKGNGVGGSVLILLLSAVFIYLGAKYTIESIVRLSDELKIGKEIIAASAVALGTSLPELMVSLTAAKNGKPEMAVGNLLGSNIFNSLAVMGVSGLVGVVIIPAGLLTFALPLMVGATLLYAFITMDKQITMWEGGFLVLFYLFYLGKLFNLL